MSGDDVLDTWVAEWLRHHPEAAPLEEFSPDLLELARGDHPSASGRPLAYVADERVDGVPIRIYRGDEKPTGCLVYLHGGGWVIGSIGMMDHVARELAHATGAVVISVGYRLAPENPFPAGLDDCEAITRWAVANAISFDAPQVVAVAGESAGANLAAAVTLRLRDSAVPLSGQVLMYPMLDNATAAYASRDAFSGIVISQKQLITYWEAYGGSRDIDRDALAAPLHAATLRALPPALLVLAGCDLLRDEGRAYGARLREDGVPVEELCYSGQPHGFVNFGFPAAADAFDQIGRWARAVFATGERSLQSLA